jgi:hypothetical protein
MIPGVRHNDDLVEVLIMLALSPKVVDAVWSAVAPLIPKRPVADHPLGCLRPRLSDRLCFEAILFRLVTGVFMGCGRPTGERL